MTVLFKNGTANGASLVNYKSSGSAAEVHIVGNFDGASVNVEVRSPADPNDAWNNQKTYLEPDDDSIFYLPSGYLVRGVISSAGASTDIFLEVSA